MAGRTLAQLIADLRLDLGDADSSNYRWTDSDLTRYIDRAKRRVQEVYPRDRSTDIATVAGTYEYSLASVTDLLKVWRVQRGTTTELASEPRPWVPFEVYAGNLRLLGSEPPVAGETIRVHYGGTHTVDSSGNTLPPEWEDMLCVGGFVYAVANQEVERLGQFNLGSHTVEEWHALVGAKVQSWERGLAQLRRLDAYRAGGYGNLGGWTDTDRGI